jgi:hypothetical protein
MTCRAGDPQTLSYVRNVLPGRYRTLVQRGAALGTEQWGSVEKRAMKLVVMVGRVGFGPRHGTFGVSRTFWSSVVSTHHHTVAEYSCPGFDRPAFRCRP